MTTCAARPCLCSLSLFSLPFSCAVFLSFWLAARLARPLVRLTTGAAEVSRGNLDYQLPYLPGAERDEIKRLTSAFNQMVSSLKERNEQLQLSRDNLQHTATDLQQWVQNYLDALEFITHELKNQIAAMKINLLAVRDGYIGKISREQTEALDDVAQAIYRSEEMINELPEPFPDRKRGTPSPCSCCAGRNRCDSSSAQQFSGTS